MATERIFHLIARQKAGELSPEETIELEELIRLNPGWHFSLDMLTEYWEMREHQLVDGEAVYERHRDRLKNPVNHLPPGNTVGMKIRKHLNWAVPVAVIVLIMIFFAKPSLTSLPETTTVARQLKTVATDNGSRSKVMLPDGSAVWLNAGSTLTYDDDFGEDNRLVNLTGEAYFDVVKDSIRPFFIHTPVMKVKVTGTILNIKSYSGDDQAEASLIRGSIEVTANDFPEKQYILKPSEKIILRNTANTNAATTPGTNSRPELSLASVGFLPSDSSIVETSWVMNKLVFVNEPLEDLAVMLTRWYGVPVELEDKNLKNIRFTGNFEHETLAQALEALQLTGGFHFKQQESGFIIYK